MVSAASSSTSRTPLVEPKATSSDKPLSSSSTPPFTDVLIEATSKVLRDGLDKPEALSRLSQKGESTKEVAFKNAKEERSGSSSKKSVPIDISTQLVPIIVSPVPLVITQTAPVAAPAIARIVKEPVPKQAKVEAVTTIDAQDLKPSATILNVDAAVHPGLERTEGIERKETESNGLTPAVSPKAVAFEIPDPKVIASIESAQVKIAHAIESLDKSSTLTTKSAKPERPHDAPLRAKSTAAVSEHVSSIRISTQPDVISVWPTQPSISVSGVNAISAPAHITQPSPHFLDVRELVGAISRPLDEARGGYTVMIAMHPVELGHLQAVVTLHGSDLHVLITPQTQMGHDALTSAVDTLKTELSRGGVNVNVTLQDPGSQPRGGDRPQTTSAPREVFTQEESIASAAPALSVNAINLVL